MNILQTVTRKALRKLFWREEYPCETHGHAAVVTYPVEGPYDYYVRPWVHLHSAIYHDEDSPGWQVGLTADLLDHLTIVASGWLKEHAARYPRLVNYHIGVEEHPLDCSCQDGYE